jgi:uncharacterized membrane protein
MAFSYSVSAKGHLLLAIEALKFAREQPAVGEATRRKIALALASARRDLARVGDKRRKRGRKSKVTRIERLPKAGQPKA